MSKALLLLPVQEAQVEFLFMVARMVVVKCLGLRVKQNRRGAEDAVFRYLSCTSFYLHF